MNMVYNDDRLVCVNQIYCRERNWKNWKETQQEIFKLDT